MKRIFSVFAILFAAVTLGGCRIFTKEEMIPEHLGEPEGLWLYRGNERMRTDGSEREYLFEEIDLDGETVSDFEVDDCLYCTGEGKAFFSLARASGYCLYLFDYAEKRGEVLLETEDELRMTSSDGYVYAQSNEKGYLYRQDGVLVASELEGDFSLVDGLLCSLTDDAFFWWEDGLHSVALTPAAKAARPRHDFFVQNNRFGFAGPDAVFFIDLEREELTDVAYKGHWRAQRRVSGAEYFLTYDSYDRSPQEFRLYEVKNGELRLAYTFPWEAEVSFLEGRSGIINFYCVYTAAYTGKVTYGYCHYSIADGKLYNGEVKFPREADDALVCGKYAFWVSSHQYGPVFGGGTCYYLNRRHDGIEEIMQYSFDNDGYFFDDIRAE